MAEKAGDECLDVRGVSVGIRQLDRFAVLGHFEAEGELLGPS